MSVRLSIAIMHAPLFPQRRAMVNDLVRTLQKQGDLRDFSLVRHFRVVEDTRGEGVWPTAKRAFQEALVAPRSPTHHLVLQDDTKVCSNFIRGAIAALGEAPHGPVSFFANRKIVEKAREVGSSWARIDDGTWMHGLALPTDLVSNFLVWEKMLVNPEYQHDDRRVMLWAHANSLPVYCTVPSLVDHGAPSSSTLGHNNPKRVARWFIGDKDPLGIDWTRGVSRPPVDRGSVHWVEVATEALL